MPVIRAFFMNHRTYHLEDRTFLVNPFSQRANIGSTTARAAPAVMVVVDKEESDENSKMTASKTTCRWSVYRRLAYLEFLIGYRERFSTLICRLTMRTSSCWFAFFPSRGKKLSHPWS